MVKITGNDIWRDGQRIGWIENNYIRARDGKRLGYYSGKYIYAENGSKLAFIEGDYLCSETDPAKKVRLETINETITGGIFPEICKCTVYILLGN
ncbi:hypothetical protein KGO95_00250 [Patescibacteria group bacterium]|nr:hypothetical protein [Patescibacteria group bacterium]